MTPLMLKLADNPPVLPNGIHSLSELPGTWYIAHTKARNEKAFAWDLAAAGVGYYLPMISRVHFSGGRKRHVLKPLFPSYVFFNGDEPQRYRALTTNRLCQVISVTDQPALARELLAIEQAINSKVSIDLYPFAAVGQRVRIAAGPLMGLEGIVVERGKLSRIVLQVSMLGQGAAVQTDADLLEPAECEDSLHPSFSGVLR